MRGVYVSSLLLLPAEAWVSGIWRRSECNMGTGLGNNSDETEGDLEADIFPVISGDYASIDLSVPPLVILLFTVC